MGETREKPFDARSLTNKFANSKSRRGPINSDAPHDASNDPEPPNSSPVPVRFITPFESEWRVDTSPIWVGTLAGDRRSPQADGRNDPDGFRTRVAGVKGRSPRPLDDGAIMLLLRINARRMLQPPQQSVVGNRSTSECRIHFRADTIGHNSRG